MISSRHRLRVWSQCGGGVAALLLVAASALAEDTSWAPAGERRDAEVVPATVTRLPATTVSATRMAELEARIAELEREADDKKKEEQKKADDKKKDADKPYEVGSDLAMTTKFGKNGFEAETKNKDFKIHIGGRTQLDYVALTAPNLRLGGVGAQDAVGFRRARLRCDGVLWETMDYVAEYDFVNSINVDPTAGAAPIAANGGNVANDVAPVEIWWGFHELPGIGNLRVGLQKEAIGLEHMNSSRFLDFMERSYLQDAFTGPFNNGFSPGIAAYNWNEDQTMTWNVGAYKNVQNVFQYDTGDNEYAFTGRLTYLPYYDEPTEGRYLVHTGMAVSYRGLDEAANVAAGNFRIRSRASLRNGPGALNPNLADTNFAGRIFAESQTILAPEIAVVAGPWLLQGEYMGSFTNSTVFTPVAGAPVNVGQAYFQGMYFQALYFLTGEHREYERKEARFGRVIPIENAAYVRGIGWCGLGAWQVGARYGFLDLTDSGINGGYIQDLTVGLNWFLNPNAKVQFNYIYQHVNQVAGRNANTGVPTIFNDGNMNGFGVRFAHDF